MTRALSGVIGGVEEKFEKTSVWDPRSECRFVAARPEEEPELWSAYLDGAREGYHRYGADKALEFDRTRDGSSTSLFFAAIAPDGSVVGGLRAQGPYENVDQAHAVVEWSGQRGEAQVRTMIADRIPFGVVEMKAAWVAVGAPNRGELTRSLGRYGCCTLELLDVQFLLATAAEHVLELWKSSGGEVAERIPPTPYPDERYRTRMMWWDRRNHQGGLDGRSTDGGRFARLRPRAESGGDGVDRAIGMRARSVS
ncbi:hypothetical protein GCM10023094_01040 [Rhodococcus olei]|uniref:N-acetyltransferase domain-containing protein n=1 Tax=Rhodococcus olei TaxID=2161675 RepID=A0ABP8NQF4_9NOCA